MTRIDRTNLETLADELGADHGRSAALWWAQETIGGRASGDTRAAATRTLRGIAEGDPAVLDTLPSCDLSGEWADGLTPAGVAAILGDPDLAHEEPDALDALCDRYCDAFALAAQDMIERACLRALEPERA